MKGSVWRRCYECRSKVTGQTCDCGSDSYSWAFRVDVGTTPGGGRKQKFRMGFATRQEAERELRRLLHKVDHDRFIDRHDLLLGRYLEDEWLPAVKPPNLRESTWSSYAGELRRHVIPSLGDARIQDLRPGHLNRLYGQLLRSGRKDRTGGLSARTVLRPHDPAQSPRRRGSMGNSRTESCRPRRPASPRHRAPAAPHANVVSRAAGSLP